jgi:hypothetical protein
MHERKMVYSPPQHLIALGYAKDIVDLKSSIEVDMELGLWK